MHNHAEKSLLHVAPPSKCNTQQPTPNCATGNATHAQQPPSKPASLLDLARNRLRNNHATTTQNGTQQAPEKSLLLVASARECNTQQANSTAHWHWIVELPAKVIETYHHPAATRAEVLRRYPDALDLEPMPEASSTATPEQDAELAALVRAVGREYGFDAAELAEALEAAGRDPAGAWLSYRKMAHELGIELAP